MPAMSGDADIEKLLQRGCVLGEGGSFVTDARMRAGAAEILRLRAAHAALLTERDALAERLRLATEWRPIETCPAITPELDQRILLLDLRMKEPVTITVADGDWWRRRLKEGAKGPNGWLPLPSPEGTADAS
jgi:hypothetical protein